MCGPGEVAHPAVSEHTERRFSKWNIARWLRWARIRWPDSIFSDADNHATSWNLDHRSSNIFLTVFALMGRGRDIVFPAVFQIVKKKKTAALHSTVFGTLICCETFRTRSLKVMSPGHVKWPHLRTKVRPSYSDSTIASKLWGLTQLAVPIKCFFFRILILVT